MLASVVFRERLALASVIGFAAVIVGMLCVNGQARWSGASPGLIRRAGRGDLCAMVIFNKRPAASPDWRIPCGKPSPRWHGGPVHLFRRGLAIHVPPGSCCLLVLGLLNTGSVAISTSPPSARAQKHAIRAILNRYRTPLFAAAFLGELPASRADDRRCFHPGWSSVRSCCGCAPHQVPAPVTSQPSSPIPHSPPTHSPIPHSPIQQFTNSTPPIQHSLFTVYRSPPPCTPGMTLTSP